MKDSSSLNDSDLIDFVYGIAGEEIVNQITDFTDRAKWRKVVSELKEPLRYTYLIGILDMQVRNGGFIQYYDNDYGIFCRETALALKKLNAELAFNLVSDSIKVLEKFKSPNMDLLDYITDNVYWDNDEIESVMNNLDTEYYDLDEKQNLGKLLAKYLRANELD